MKTNINLIRKLIFLILFIISCETSILDDVKIDNLDIFKENIEDFNCNNEFYKLSWNMPHNITKIILTYPPHSNINSEDQLELVKIIYEDSEINNNSKIVKKIKWKNADIKKETNGNDIISSIKSSINKKNYIKTSKLKIKIPSLLPNCQRIQILTLSKIKTINLYLQIPHNEVIDLKKNITNIRFGELNSEVLIKDDDYLVYKINLNHSITDLKNKYDKSILEIKAKSKTISVKIDDIINNNVLFLKELDIKISNNENLILNKKHINEKSKDHIKEKSKEKTNSIINLGTEESNQKFGIDKNANILIKYDNSNNNNFFEDTNSYSLIFDFENWYNVYRYIEKGFLPILQEKWIKNDIHIKRTSFVKYYKDFGNILISHFELYNECKIDKKIQIPIYIDLKNSEDKNNLLKIIKKKNIIYYKIDKKEYSGIFFNSGHNNILQNINIINNKLIFDIKLKKQKRSSLTLNIAYYPIEAYKNINNKQLQKTERILSNLKKNLNIDYELKNMVKYWNKKLSYNYKLKTISEDLNNFNETYLIQCLINNKRNNNKIDIGLFNNDLFNDDFERENIKYKYIKELLRRNYSKYVYMYLSEELKKAKKSHYYLNNNIYLIDTILFYYQITNDINFLNENIDFLIKSVKSIIYSKSYPSCLNKIENYRIKTEINKRQMNIIPIYNYKTNKSIYSLKYNIKCYQTFNLLAKILTETNHDYADILKNESKLLKTHLKLIIDIILQRNPTINIGNERIFHTISDNICGIEKDHNYKSLNQNHIEYSNSALNLIKTEFLADNSKEHLFYEKDLHNYIYNAYNEIELAFLGLIDFPYIQIINNDIEKYHDYLYKVVSYSFDKNTRSCLTNYQDLIGLNISKWSREIFIWEFKDSIYIGRMLPFDWLENNEDIGIQKFATIFGKMSIIYNYYQKQKKMLINIETKFHKNPKNIFIRIPKSNSMKIKNIKMNKQKYQYNIKNNIINLNSSYKSNMNFEIYF